MMFSRLLYGLFFVFGQTRVLFHSSCILFVDECSVVPSAAEFTKLYRPGRHWGFCGCSFPPVERFSLYTAFVNSVPFL